MELKDILVFLRAGGAWEAPLALAADLARRHGASLSAVCACEEPPLDVADGFVIGSEGVAEVIARRNARITARVAPVKAAFHAALADRSGGPGRWMPGEPDAAPESLAIQARICDLAVLARSAGRGGADHRLAELVALGAGTPCLLVPPDGSSCAEFARVVLAWDGSREAKRALTDGLGFLSAARTVTLVIAGGEAAPDGVLRHLARHGVVAELMEVEAGHGGPGAALLRACHALAGDLLIMGAYGRSRSAELILGGATRTILADAELPVLLSH